MGFKENVGISVDEQEPVARIATEERHANDNGGVQGGLIATLLDAAMGRAVRVDEGDDATVVTVQLSITYLNGAEPGDVLVARAEVLKRTKTLALITADVTREGDGEHIAQGQATFAITHKG